MLNGCGIFGTFVRPMYAFGRPRKLHSRGLIRQSLTAKIKKKFKAVKIANLFTNPLCSAKSLKYSVYNKMNDVNPQTTKSLTA